MTIAKSDLKHPFAFLVFLTELLNVYYNRMIQGLGKEISELEKKLGITRGIMGFQGWNWKPDVFRTYTQEIYRLTVTPIYLERRFVFLISLNNFLLDCLPIWVENATPDFVGKDIVTAANATLLEALENNMHLAKGRLHQTQCLEKRLHNLILTVC
jgi:hypothetical protein